MLLLIQADHVSRRVAEPRSDFGSVSADWLHDLTPAGNDRINRGGDAIDHHIEQKAGL